MNKIKVGDIYYDNVIELFYKIIAINKNSIAYKCKIEINNRWSKTLINKYPMGMRRFLSMKKIPKIKAKLYG